MSELLEDRVRNELHAALGSGPSVDDDWEGLQPRLGPARRRRQRQLIAAVSAAVVLVVLAVVAARTSTRERVDTGPVNHPRVTTTTVPDTTTSTAAPLDRNVSIVSRTSIPAAPGEMIATSTGAWVISGNVPEGPAPRLLHITPSGRIASTTTFPGVVQSPVYLASGEGSIWALAWDTATLFRIDPATGRISGRLNLADAGFAGEPEWVAAGLGHVWVTMCCDQPGGPNQRLLQLDPSSLKVQGETGVPGAGENERVVVGPQVLLVTGEGYDKVLVVDPTNLHSREVGVEGGAGVVAVDALMGKVWVVGRWFASLGAGFTLDRIDPTSLTSSHELDWPVEGVGQIAAGGGVVWARQATGGRLFVRLANGNVLEVPGTETVPTGVISASGDSLWAIEGSQLVQYQGS